MSEKILEERWSELKSMVVSLEIPPRTMAVMERCFYAGALVAFNAITDIIARNPDANEKAVEKIKDLHSELGKFAVNNINKKTH